MKRFFGLFICIMLFSFASLCESQETTGAYVTGLNLPGYVNFRSKHQLTGVVTSSEPFTGVTISVYNERSLEIDQVSSISIEGDPVYTYDLETVFKKIRTQTMISGEKQLWIDIECASGTVRAHSMDFYVRGPYMDVAHMTKDFSLRDAHKKQVNGLINNYYRDGWQNYSGKDHIQATLNTDRIPEALVLKWSLPPAAFRLTYMDADGAVIEEVQYENEIGLWNTYHVLPENLHSFILNIDDKEIMLNELRVYEKGKVPSAVQRWEKWPEDLDLMLIVAHKNDETLYFSGTIPLTVSEGRNAAVVVMTKHATRPGQEELFECLWAAGLKYQPLVLMNYDGKPEYDKCADMWGGYDNVAGQLVELYRRYTPEVVLTHDENGEFGHVQHILTSDLVVDSVSRSWDKNWYPESAEKYGVWDVPKLYLHLYKEENRIHLPFDEKLDFFSGRSPMEVAYAAFDKYQSTADRPAYSLDGDGLQYDKTFFGLYRSTVGPDVLKNSFFENID